MNGKLKATYDPEKSALRLQRVYSEGKEDGPSWGYVFSPEEADLIQEAIRVGLGISEKEE